MLRAVGFRQGQILELFLLRHLAAGLLGGVLGCAAGLSAALLLSRRVPAPLFGPEALLAWPWLAGTFAAAVLLSIAGGWVPALAAAQQDPASILREE